MKITTRIIAAIALGTVSCGSLAAPSNHIGSWYCQIQGQTTKLEQWYNPTHQHEFGIIELPNGSREVANIAYYDDGSYGFVADDGYTSQSFHVQRSGYVRFSAKIYGKAGNYGGSGICRWYDFAKYER